MLYQLLIKYNIQQENQVTNPTEVAQQPVAPQAIETVNQQPELNVQQTQQAAQNTNKVAQQPVQQSEIPQNTGTTTPQTNVAQNNIEAATQNHEI